MYKAMVAGGKPILSAHSGRPTSLAVRKAPMIAAVTPRVANFFDSLLATFQVPPGTVAGVSGIRSGFIKTKISAAKAQKITAFQ
jgi:hypothetical protein